MTDEIDLDDPFVYRAEAIRRTGLSIRDLNSLISSGRVRYIEIPGRRTRISLCDVRRATRPVTAGAAKRAVEVA